MVGYTNTYTSVPSKMHVNVNFVTTYIPVGLCVGWPRPCLLQFAGLLACPLFRADHQAVPLITGQAR